MIDDLVVEMQITPPQEVLREIHGTFEYCGVIFQPKFRMGRVTKYYGNLKNLLVEILYDKLFIRNSWHKYYHGNNHGDFTYGEIKQTIQLLTGRFGKGFLEAKIKKMAVGCNLPMDAGNIIIKCLALGPDIFQDMKFGNKHRTYGKYIKKTHSKFKVYNKQWEVKEHDRQKITPTLRLELELNMIAVQARKINPIPLMYVKDLLDDFRICSLLDVFLEKVQQVVFDYDMPIEKHDIFKDVEIKVFMKDPVLRKLVKDRTTPKTYRQWAKRYEELKELYAEKGEITKLVKMCEENLVQLLRLNQLV
ncbi:MAG: hypothetical protein WD398_05580 [Cyclobacteriaceae bacterium]